MNVEAGALARPLGVVTFLFTDIEGSTRRWEADPELMRSALEVHDAVLREAVEKYSGWLFKHTGDGVCAVFSSPRAAVDTAIAAQRSLQLPVRMGIATGEAETRDGDYFGAVLNRAARVMSAGHGGQVLLDSQTAGLVSDIELISLGSKRLRDLAKAVDIFQVRAPGLGTEFPALRTVDPTPGNLRLPTTSFVGRDSELADLESELRSRRIVTLTGVGGVGKTRLALEAASRMAASFRDGVWVVELAPVGDPAAVPGAVASVLGITQQPGMSLSESVAAALEGRSRLLVFDNCEHLLDAVADLTYAILARAADVRILATSREGLRVADERLWPVASLDVATTATALFTQRASDVDPDASLVETMDPDAVLEICRRLDGIPLAIELAASRLQSMTVGEVRDRLDDRFRLLIGARRGLGRHQTLRHAVQWSFDLLDDAEKSLLAHCSVFAGGFDLTSACVVSGLDDEFATLDLLDSLVRKSLLVADRSSGHTRFSMLETIRQFAEDQLVACGEADIVRASHASYFAGLEGQLFDLWDGPRQREAYAWLIVEFANLRAAFRWAADRRDLDDASAIAFYTTFIGSCIEQRESISWAEELVTSGRFADHPRLAQLSVMAAQCYAAGRIEDSLSYGAVAQTAIASGRYLPVPFDFETNLGGGSGAVRGEAERWVQICRNVINRSAGPHTYARSSLTLGLTLAGATSEALTEAHGLVAAADATDNPHVKSYALASYGVACRDADPVAARTVQRRGLVIAQGSGNKQVEHVCAVGLARLSATLGDDPLEALGFLELAIRIRDDSGSFSLLHPPLAILGTLLDRLGHYPQTAVIFGFAITPLTHVFYPETAGTIAHLRQALGDDEYEALAHSGKEMGHAAMAQYAFEQIDLARAELEK